MNAETPWREVATPHEDVLRGDFQEAEFAVDLSKVREGKAPPEYQRCGARLRGSPAVKRRIPRWRNQIRRAYLRARKFWLSFYWLRRLA
jgi:hypothetical protein